MPKKPISASQIRKSMTKKWAAPEWAIMWEVANSTGARGNRYADAVMMSLWPSRGLELHGVEIKVSLSDWKREAADPTKAEAIAQFCDRWWIHTPKDLIKDVAELPPAWGLREFDGRAWRTINDAERTDVEPVTRGFLAALLRRADETQRLMIEETLRESHAAAINEAEEQRRKFKDEVQRAAVRRTSELSKVAERISDFDEAFGSDFIGGWSDVKTVATAARSLADINSDWGSTLQVIARLRKTADELEALRQLSSPEPDSDSPPSEGVKC